MRRPAAPLVLVALLAAVVGGAVLGTVTAVQPALACSCVERTDDEAFDAADVVFTGTVVDVDLPDVALGSMAPKRYTLEVDAVYRGEAAAEQVVVTAVESASCGAEIGAGAWLVFATVVVAGEERLDGVPEAAASELRTSLCSGNRPVGASPVPASFGEPGAPTDAGTGDAAAVDDEEDRTAGFVAMLVAVVVFVVGFSVIAVRARRRPGDAAG